MLESTEEIFEKLCGFRTESAFAGHATDPIYEPTLTASHDADGPPAAHVAVWLHWNLVTLTRDATFNLTRISAPNGHWITLTDDASYRITQLADTIGRTVGYAYDASGRLWKVTDPEGACPSTPTMSAIGCSR